MALESSIEGDYMKNFILGVATIILSVAYFAEPVAAQAPVDLAGEWALILEPPQRGGGGGRAVSRAPRAARRRVSRFQTHDFGSPRVTP